MNLSKDAEIPAGARNGQLPDVSGKFYAEASWRVEEGGRFFRKTVDLNLVSMTANLGKLWVGACHNKDKQPFDGTFRHGGDTKAKAGGMASERIYFDFTEAKQDPDIVHTVFAITCFGNRMALANLAELRVQLFAPDGTQLLLGGRRSVQGQASAALAIYMNAKTGFFQEVANTYDVNGSAQNWRQLADSATGILPSS